ncbi:hypothetical protein CPBF367_17210 [Xanthomonas arboricola pv. juglandis]|uniref:hypothetical protein n=1 Tax=Xanthomonas euroxanthea TaxID=2259622 RepID=UPI000E904EA4|nr:hypothetical protein [Xanthomonas euroxanthea]SYZ53645.1 hypothetical protein CPBF367_17210 [Xanthomonas arboricola pv. juglandis]
MSDTLRAACEAPALRAAATPHHTSRLRCSLSIGGLLIAFAAAVPQADAHKVPGLSLTQVLDQLRRDIAAVPASDPTPIDTVMKRYADTSGQSFDIASPDPAEDPSEAVSPTQPAGVTDAEWHALQAYRARTTSEADDLSENRGHHYTLIDLDEDGQRDLLDDAYVGGTGLFTQITVLRVMTMASAQPPPRPQVQPDSDCAPGRYRGALHAYSAHRPRPPCSGALVSTMPSRLSTRTHAAH